MAVHPKGSLFAVGEKSSNPTINIFTTADYRLYRILRNGTTRAFSDLCFNDTGELLATQGGWAVCRCVCGGEGVEKEDDVCVHCVCVCMFVCVRERERVVCVCARACACV